MECEARGRLPRAGHRRASALLHPQERAALHVSVFATTCLFPRKLSSPLLVIVELTSGGVFANYFGLAMIVRLFVMV